MVAHNVHGIDEIINNRTDTGNDRLMMENNSGMIVRSSIQLLTCQYKINMMLDQLKWINRMLSTLQRIITIMYMVMANNEEEWKWKTILLVGYVIGMSMFVWEKYKYGRTMEESLKAERRSMEDLQEAVNGMHR